MRTIPGVLLISALILASVGMALAQEKDPNASGAASAGATSTGAVEVPGPIDAQGNMQAGTDAQANAETDATLTSIRERAKKASSKACAAVQKQLAEISRQIDAEADMKGDILVAGRVAPEFGMSAEAMTAEESNLGAGLGELIIAHTLIANSRTAVTADQLFTLHREGMGWGQIAHGLNLRIGELTAAVKSEYNVAAGRAKADGRAAMIHSGTNVSANTKAGVHAGPASAGAASSVGVGVKVGN